MFRNRILGQKDGRKPFLKTQIQEIREILGGKIFVFKAFEVESLYRNYCFCFHKTWKENERL